ncbi:MAG TPA: histidine kinase [Verrucomicrobiae bacterium]|nr:histidine kinase [Verrucomicrobiae bacterium]
MAVQLLTRRWIRWLLGFVIWTLIGLAFAGQLYLVQAKLGDPVTWQFAIGRKLADWYVFAILSIPIWWLARHFPIERARWHRTLLVHIAGASLFSLCWMVFRAGLEHLQSRWGPQPVSFETAFTQALVATFVWNALIYWALVSLAHALGYYLKYQERTVRAAELEKRLTEARLQALQMQLNPHFLFNTLHAISSLMHQNVEAADRMLARLSDLLRYALESTDSQEVPLRKELDFLTRYLEIEQTRFGERLKVRLQIEPAAMDVNVPNLVLQPLVENAIKHGIEPHARPGVVELRARRENGMLHLEVEDNGEGLRSAKPSGFGVGLSNTRARLEQLYGEHHRLEMVNGPSGGLLVRLSIPWRTAKLEPAAA